MDLTGMMQAAAGVGGGGIPWNISTAQYNGSPLNFLCVDAAERFSTGLFFKPDGTKVYICGSTNDVVAEYNLPNAWNFTGATFVQTLDISTQESTPQGLFFKPDGTKMYVIGSADDDISEYNLSTAWDISSASYSQNFSVASQDNGPIGIFFKSDGLSLYISGVQNGNIYEYSLSSAWDISTASYVRSFSTASQDSNVRGIFFKSDGTKMYFVGQTNNYVFEYNLSTAWNISTASYVQSYDASSIALGNLSGLHFKSDGTKMFVTGATLDSIVGFDISSAWDISTASFSYPSNAFFDINTEEATAEALFFKSDGTKMYVLGRSGDDVNEYNLSTAWDISTASYVQAFSVNAQDSNPQGLFFKPDGTKMYMCGSTNDRVNEYSLSSAWDVSSASYVQNFSVLAQDGTGPLAVFFKDDGTKMYITGSASDSVHEYDLSSAWDISSASFLQSFSVAAQATDPSGLFFKDDGTKMYVLNAFLDNVNEYDLSTAWDISTASYSHSFLILQTKNPRGVYFRNDGIKMYICSQLFNAIFEYDL